MSQAQYKRKIDSEDETKMRELNLENGDLVIYKKGLSRLEGILFCLVVILAILCIVFIVLYAFNINKGTGKTGSANTNSTTTCTAASCVSVASGMFI